MPAGKLSQPRPDQLGACPFKCLKALFDGRTPNPELASADAAAGLALRLKAVRV